MQEKEMNSNQPFIGVQGRNIKRTIMVWTAINTGIGLLIGTMLSAISSFPVWLVFLLSLINTHIISSFSAAAGYYFGRKVFNMRAVKAILLNVAGVYPATLAGIALCSLVNYLIVNGAGIVRNRSVAGYFIQNLVPSLVLAAAITAVAAVIERLIAHKKILEQNLENARTGSTRSGNTVMNGLAVKEGENLFLVNPVNIIYLSSHGKKTIIHTEERDFESSHLISEIEKKLDADVFIRVHKQFILNLRYVLNIRYYSGGSYLAYLNDQDESTIPVGRTYVSRLKDRLNV